MQAPFDQGYSFVSLWFSWCSPPLSALSIFGWLLWWWQNDCSSSSCHISMFYQPVEKRFSVFLAIKKRSILNSDLGYIWGEVGGIYNVFGWSCLLVSGEVAQVVLSGWLVLMIHRCSNNPIYVTWVFIPSMKSQTYMWTLASKCLPRAAVLNSATLELFGKP